MTQPAKISAAQFRDAFGDAAFNAVPPAETDADRAKQAALVTAVQSISDEFLLHYYGPLEQHHNDAFVRKYLGDETVEEFKQWRGEVSQSGGEAQQRRLDPAWCAARAHRAIVAIAAYETLPGTAGDRRLADAFNRSKAFFVQQMMASGLLAFTPSRRYAPGRSELADTIFDFKANIPG